MKKKDKLRKMGFTDSKVEPKKTEVKPPVITPAPAIKETSILKEAIALQKEGFIIIDIKSEIKGIRLKTWVLKKEV